MGLFSRNWQRHLLLELFFHNLLNGTLDRCLQSIVKVVSNLTCRLLHRHIDHDRNLSVQSFHDQGHNSFDNFSDELVAYKRLRRGSRNFNLLRCKSILNRFGRCDGRRLDRRRLHSFSYWSTTDIDLPQRFESRTLSRLLRKSIGYGLRSLRLTNTLMKIGINRMGLQFVPSVRNSIG